jgi:hypothetical protein
MTEHRELQNKNYRQAAIGRTGSWLRAFLVAYGGKG